MTDQGIKIGYARVSTGEQDLRMQRDALIAFGVNQLDIWEEKASGASVAKRHVFQAMMKDIRKGDTVCVWKLDRLARNMSDLLDTAKQIEARGATLAVVTMPGMNTDTPVGRVMFQLLGVFAEFERAIALERTMAGLASARAAGRRGGNRSKHSDEAVLALHDAGVTKAEAARQLKMSQPGYMKRLASALKRKAEGEKNNEQT